MSTNIVAGSTPTDYETATLHTITVRETLAGASNSPRDTVLTINVSDVSDTDTTPDAFTFTDQTGVALSTPITSNTIVVAGITAPAPLSITGGQYSINGGTFASTPTTVVNGNTVAVKVTSSSANATPVNAVLTIGGVSDTFTVTTLAGSGFSPAEGTNLLTFESDLTNAVYTKGNGATISANIDGVADGLVYPATGNSPNITRLTPDGVCVDGNLYRASLRVKKNVTAFRYVMFTTDFNSLVQPGTTPTSIVFDLNTDTIVSGSPTRPNCSAGILDEGGGYHLIWVKYVQISNFGGALVWAAGEVAGFSYSEAGDGVTAQQYWKIWKLENLGVP